MKPKLRLTKNRKRCRDCGEVKLRTDFNKSTANRDRLRTDCRECQAQYYRQHTRQATPTPAQLDMWEPIRRSQTFRVNWEGDEIVSIEVMKESK